MNIRDRASQAAYLWTVQQSAASNQFVGLEHLTQQEIDEFRAKCESAAKRATSAGEAGECVSERADDDAIP